MKIFLESKNEGRSRGGGGGGGRQLPTLVTLPQNISSTFVNVESRSSLTNRKKFFPLHTYF